MDENEVRRSSSRSGVWAAVAICFIGIILIAGVIAVFGAMNCNTVTDLINSGKTGEAMQEYASMNPAGKLLFTKKVESAMLSQYKSVLGKGYVTTARNMTDLMIENFDDFRFSSYAKPLAVCAAKALWNGEYEAAADTVIYILEKDQNADISVLTDALESNVEIYLNDGDYDAAFYILDRIPEPNLEPFVKGLCAVAYNIVFKSGEPDFSLSAGAKLKNCLATSERYNLDGVPGAGVLIEFLNHYISACNRYGSYFEVYNLLKAVGPDLEEMSKNFNIALNTDIQEKSWEYAETALFYANSAVAKADAFDSTQLGVTEYKSLCSKYADNATKMTKWIIEDEYLVCSETQSALDLSREQYNAEINDNVKGFAESIDVTLNNRILAIYK
ncbi:MAG: hypothetical protein J5562_05775 [Clostridia bacterium]|nr:hypothetical protein [Clostridia bacterium]